MASKDIFENFERIQRMTERVIDRLGPPNILCIEGPQEDAEVQDVTPSLREETAVCTAVVVVDLPIPAVRNVQTADSTVAHYLQYSDVLPLVSVEVPTFAAPHNVFVEEESLEALDNDIEWDVRRKSLEKKRESTRPSFERGRVHNSGGHSQKSVSSLGSESTECDLSDVSWHPGTELSPSSCEFLSHSDTSSESTEAFFEREEGEKIRLQRSASPIRSRTGLKSTGKLRRSRRREERKWEDFSAKKRLYPDELLEKKNDEAVTTSIPKIRKRQHQFQREKTFYQHPISTALAKQHKPLKMPRAGMGKEKETFEVWSKPKRGDEKEHCDGASQEEVNEAQHDSGASTEETVPDKGGPSKMSPVGTTGRQGGARKRMSFGTKPAVVLEDADRSDGISPVDPELAGGGSLKGRNGQTQSSAFLTKSIQQESLRGDDAHPKNFEKEKAVTMSEDEEDGRPFSPVSLDFGEQQRKPAKKKVYSLSDSDLSDEERRPRRKESFKKRRRAVIEESGGSSESQLSPSRDGRDRKTHRRSRRKGSGRFPGVRHRREKGFERRRGRGSSPDSNGDTDGSEDRRRRRRQRHESTKFRREGKNRRDYSHDEESSGSSDEAARYRRELSNMQTKNPKVEIERDETRKRQDRRSKQGERENERRLREKQGLKGHYITVDPRGIPYGFGVGAWRAELNKLSGSLDPSITNIRFQPEDAMGTLRRRLKDNFEYSGPVDRAYIRKLAGKAVTQRRSRILNSMKDGDDCPSGLDRDVWRRLDRICQDPSREELSQRMKHANAARVNKGRTGPKGEEGIREDLFRKLGREPDPEELHFEMRREKGYEGVSQKKRLRMERNVSVSSEEGGFGTLKELVPKSTAVDHERMTLVIGEGVSQSNDVDVEYVRNMEYELHQLRTALKASKELTLQATIGDGGACSSMPTGGPESKATAGLQYEGRSTEKTTRKGKEVMRDGTPPPQRKSRRNRRT